MKTYKQNIGHDAITQNRAQAELGDPRAFVATTARYAKYKVTLQSRAYADNRIRQKTFYFTDAHCKIGSKPELSGVVGGRLSDVGRR